MRQAFWSIARARCIWRGWRAFVAGGRRCEYEMLTNAKWGERVKREKDNNYRSQTVHTLKARLWASDMVSQC